MTTVPDSRDLSSFKAVVRYDEPPERPPPILLVGPLAWLRENLFHSWFDALLTVGATILIVSVVIGLLSWIIGEANWFAITFNLRLLLIGRYAPEDDWRVLLLLLLAAFTAGIALAAWSRIRRGTFILLAVLVALTFILPPIIRTTITPASTYVTVGQLPVASGSDQLIPTTALAFIGKAGEPVSVQIADEASSEESLAGLNGFADDSTTQLRNTAGTRIDNTARSLDLQNLLSGDTLTGNQRLRLQRDLDKLVIPEPVTTTYALNQTPVTVRILQGTTVLGEATLDNNSEPLSVTLPEDGWYVIEKQTEGDASDVLLEMKGVFPLLQRDLFRSAEGGSTGTSTGARVSQFVRMTDAFFIEAARPTGEDGKNIPMVQTTDFPYRGTHSLAVYLSLFVGPLLGQINVILLLTILALVGGYAAGRVLDRYGATAEKPRRMSRRAATWLLLALPFLMFALVYGFFGILPLTDTQRWGGLLLTIIVTVTGVLVAFPIGVLLALGRRSKLPAISLFSTIYIEVVRGVPLITILFMSSLLVPLINPSLSATPGIFRAIIGIIMFTAAYLAENVRGGLQAVPNGQEEAARALGLSSFQITLYITLPQALRVVIPALVGMVIAGFMDTSLLVIVGVLDLVGMTNNVVSQTEFLGLRRETLVFITVVYFAISFTFANISRRIEATGAGKAMARKI